MSHEHGGGHGGGTKAEEVHKKLIEMAAQVLPPLGFLFVILGLTSGGGGGHKGGGHGHH